MTLKEDSPRKIHGLGSQDRIQIPQGQELEEDQDENCHKHGYVQGTTLLGEITIGDPRGVRNNQHSVTQTPAGEGEQGHGSQPAES